MALRANPLFEQIRYEVILGLDPARRSFSLLGRTKLLEPSDYSLSAGTSRGNRLVDSPSLNWELLEDSIKEHSGAASPHDVRKVFDLPSNPEGVADRLDQYPGATPLGDSAGKSAMCWR
jgi:hypothetical protein